MNALIKTRPPRLLGGAFRRGLTPALGRAAAARVVRSADGRYVPPPDLARTRAGRFNLQTAAHLLAVRDALIDAGIPAGRAEDLLGDLMYRVMRRLHRPIDAVAAVMHPRDPLARVRRREKIDEALFVRRPDWVMTDVDTPSGYAFDVHRCLYADYLRGRGEQEFCQRVLCAQDHRMAKGRGEVLVRTGTLAGGADRCDFHYLPAAEQKSHSGTFANGMEYLTWGTGPKTLLFIQGAPGSVAPKGGRGLRISGRMRAQYAKAVHAVWTIPRRRHMPAGHTIAGMADDYAQVISQEFGGRVGLVVGESTGGLIAQYLAAFHPHSFGHMALVATGAVLPDWGWDFDSRWGAALARGDTAGAGAVTAEMLLPGKSMRWVRRLIGPVFGRLMFAGFDCPPGDILVEAQAEEAFDARAVLPRIQAPVLLLCGDRDRGFPRDVVEETARLIPGCTLIWHKGGHLRVGSSRRVAADVLAFVDHS